MRALRFNRFGPPEVLQVVEVPPLTADASTALVRVAAASINPSDVKNVQGIMEGTNLPRVPGRDFAGTVVDGPASWIGAEVWGTGGDVGFSRDGSHAEFMRLPVAALVRKPGNLSFAEAACIGVNFVTAWLGMVDYGGVTAEDTVVVIGIGGGVGGAVAQIAKDLGARVVGVGRRTPPGDAPASRVIDAFVTLDDNTPSEVRRLTDGRGASLVYDTVGGVMFETALGMVAPRGRMVAISATGRRRVEFDLLDFFHNETCLIGADSRKLDTVESARIMAALVPGFEAGRYAPPLIAERHSLDAAWDAYQAVARGTAGRVVLTP